jgi:hypothetical protein
MKENKLYENPESGYERYLIMIPVTINTFHAKKRDCHFVKETLFISLVKMIPTGKLE